VALDDSLSLTRGPALDGITVVELSLWAAAPLAGVMLAQLGADVIKVENSATGGERSRTARFNVGIGDAEIEPGFNGYYDVMNRNKRSLALDLRSRSGRQQLRDIVGKADVFLTNFRRPVLEELGLGYSVFHAAHPRLVYGLVTGYGMSGPLSGRGGVDYTAQGRSGLMAMAGSVFEGEPRFAPGVADMTTGMLLSHGVLSALYERTRSQRGQLIEVSTLRASVWLGYWAISFCMMTGRPWSPIDRRHPLDPLNNHYCCSDGRWLAFTSIGDDAWARFARAMELPDELAEDTALNGWAVRHERADVLVETLDAIFASKPSSYWAERLGSDERIVFDQVVAVEDVVQDRQLLESHAITFMEHPVMGSVPVLRYPVTFSDTVPLDPVRSPQLGEHNQNIAQQFLTNDAGGDYLSGSE
jgi:crotonobetainyl-CoA:carnitine CoA-transferase CaiB-like acyl-CoA transferase